MKKLFDEVSEECSKMVTRKYSTSFSLAVRLLSPKIRGGIYNIYGFVRFADEIVDSFHDYPKEKLLNKFEKELDECLEDGISLNPIINSFCHTVKKYKIKREEIGAFLGSMRADLNKKNYQTKSEIDQYIYGSADVVGLMCLRVFLGGDEEKFEALKSSAMRLGSAFQKVNFLRDIKDDYTLLNRSYFPEIDLKNITEEDKHKIIQEIKEDFRQAKIGIKQLPPEAKKGVYVAYRYYLKLLNKLEQTNFSNIMKSRIRVSNTVKTFLLIDSHFRLSLKTF